MSPRSAARSKPRWRSRCRTRGCANACSNAIRSRAWQPITPRFMRAARARTVMPALQPERSRALALRNAPRAALQPAAAAAAETPRKPRQNWLLYAFLFLLPLQNLQTGYMPNFGGGLNFLN